VVPPLLSAYKVIDLYIISKFQLICLLKFNHMFSIDKIGNILFNLSNEEFHKRIAKHNTLNKLNIKIDLVHVHIFETLCAHSK
jgi:hypothetical protein